MDRARFDNGGFCDVCKMAVRYIDGILEQNATEAEIEDAVRKVCNFLPESVRTEVRIQKGNLVCTVNTLQWLKPKQCILCSLLILCNSSLVPAISSV